MNRPIELHHYLQELELAPSPAVPEHSLQIEPRELVLTRDHANGFVCGSTLLVFHPGVALIHQRDALSSLLMAQLAANARAHRTLDSELWYRVYNYHLDCVGWELESPRFHEHACTQNPITLDQIIFQVLAPVAPQRDLELMARTLDVVRSLGPADERLELWTACSHYQDRGNFQVAICQESGGQPIMHLAAFYFECTATITDLRISCFASSNCLFRAATQQILLNRNVAAAIRPMVVSRLGPAIPMFIRDLDI